MLGIARFLCSQTSFAGQQSPSRRRVPASSSSVMQGGEGNQWTAARSGTFNASQQRLQHVLAYGRSGTCTAPSSCSRLALTRSGEHATDPLRPTERARICAIPGRLLQDSNWKPGQGSARSGSAASCAMTSCNQALHLVGTRCAPTAHSATQ